MAEDQTDIHLYRSDTSGVLFFFIFFMGFTILILYSMIYLTFTYAEPFILVLLGVLDIYLFRQFTKVYDLVVITPRSIRIMNEKKKKVIYKHHEKDLEEIQLHYNIYHRQKSQQGYNNPYFNFSLKLIDKNSKVWNYGSFMSTQDFHEFKAFVEDTYQYLLKNFKIPISKYRHTNSFSESIEL
jgi:hypothetical protein